MFEKKDHKNEKDRISSVLFGSRLDAVNKDKYYELKKNKSKKVHELLITKIKWYCDSCKNWNTGTEVTKDVVIESYETQIEAKVLKIDMKTLVATFLCPECTSQVDIENKLPLRNNCENVSLKSLRKKKFE